MAMPIKAYIESLHKRIDRFLVSKKQVFLIDLVDVLFSPCYGWNVVKLETRTFYKRWIKSSREIVNEKHRIGMSICLGIISGAWVVDLYFMFQSVTGGVLGVCSIALSLFLLRSSTESKVGYMLSIFIGLMLAASYMALTKQSAVDILSTAIPMILGAVLVPISALAKQHLNG